MWGKTTKNRVKKHSYSILYIYTPSRIHIHIYICIHKNIYAHTGAIIYTYITYSSTHAPTHRHAVLCNIFMEYFETELVPRVCNIHWLMYGDDLFLIWPDDMDFDQFFIALNNLHPTIKFKYEWEVNGKLPFLDVTVGLYKNTNMLLFSVFGKSTNSCSYIHFYSSKSQNVKQKSFLCLSISPPVYINM